MLMNERQKRFCEHYAADPNATRAAIAAGYSPKTARKQGQRLLTNVDIVTYLSKLTEETFSKNIATLSEIRSFWSDVFRDPAQKTADRLKASELLVKSSGVFYQAEAPEPREDVIIYLPKMKTEEEASISETEANEQIETAACSSIR